MEILNNLIAVKIKNRINKINYVIKNPISTQQDLLIDHTQIAKNTLFGKKYHLTNITNYRLFSDHIPIMDYDTLKPYIIKSQQNQSNILWPGKIKWFAKSSGTSNEKSKFIPITNQSLYSGHFKAGKDMLAMYLEENSKSRILHGKSLMIGGSTSMEKNNNYHSGDLSGIIMENLPLWVQLKQSPSRKVALINDWEKKIQYIIKEISQQNITHISGVPSWTIIIINKLLKKLNISHLEEIWPHLELYIHGGISFTTYKESFNLCTSKPINYMETYNASEGFFGIQNKRDQEDLLLLLNHGIFYEFIPMVNNIELTEKIIPLENVKTHVIYSMVITTNGGLWRYKIGDTIYFTSIQPYKIKIYGRTKNFINAFGEELMIDNANTAIHKTSIRTASIINEYTACPVFHNNNTGSHEWFIEFKKEPSNILDFANILDEELKKTNSDYEAKRFKGIILKKPIIRLMPNQFFYNSMKKKGKIGGQNKIPRLQNDRKFIDELISYL